MYAFLTTLPVLRYYLATDQFEGIIVIKLHESFTARNGILIAFVFFAEYVVLRAGGCSKLLEVLNNFHIDLVSGYLPDVRSAIPNNLLL